MCKYYIRESTKIEDKKVFVSSPVNENCLLSESKCIIYLKSCR